MGLRDTPQVLVQSDRCLDLPLLHGVRASTHKFGGWGGTWLGLRWMRSRRRDFTRGRFLVQTAKLENGCSVQVGADFSE